MTEEKRRPKPTTMTTTATKERAERQRLRSTKRQTTATSRKARKVRNAADCLSFVPQSLLPLLLFLLLLLLTLSSAMTEAQRHNNKDNNGNSGPNYQYNEPRFHPVEEYLFSKVEKFTSDTPSFVLEVTWPRVVLFYHTASKLCAALRDDYVAVAREIRRRSVRVPVEFWAVSCEIHRDACEDLGVTAVPRVLAFPAGKIDGVVVPRTNDNTLRVDWIVTALGGVYLKSNEEEEEVAAEEGNERTEGDGTGQSKTTPQHGDSNSSNNDHNSHHRDDTDRSYYNARNGMTHHTTKQMGYGQDHDRFHEILHPHSTLSDVTADATSSLLYSLDKAVQRDGDEAIPWSYDKVRVLREWLDLLHWSLPTREMAYVHNVVNDLRSNIQLVEDNPGEISTILEQHGYSRKTLVWTDACKGHQQDLQHDHLSVSPDGSLPSSSTISCGFWKLLHVVAIGVEQQHTRVLGDLNRVVISHVLTVMRDYIRAFGFGDTDTDGPGHELVRAYDACRDSRPCQKAMGFPDGMLSLSKLTLPFRRTVPEKDDPVWKNLALWIWQQHQTYRRHSRHKHSSSSDGVGVGGGAGAGMEDGAGNDSVEDLQWPPADLCPKCYSSRALPLDYNGNDDTANNMSSGMDDSVIVDHPNSVVWNKEPVYGYLKHEYWPRTLQSPRVVVLDRWDRRKVRRFLDKTHAVASHASWWVWGIVLILSVILCMYVVGVHERFQRKARRLRRERQIESEHEQWAESWKQLGGNSVYCDEDRAPYLQRRRRPPLTMGGNGRMGGMGSGGGVNTFRPFLDD